MSASPYLLTSGVVLRRTDTKEADQILTLLTAEHGKIPVIARGVKRKGCRYAAAAEAFTLAQLERGFRTLDYYKSLRGMEL